MTSAETFIYWFFFGLISILLGLFTPVTAGSTNTADFQRPANSVLLLLTLSIVVGAVLRIANLDFGFPELYHPDEFRKARILRSMSEAASWNPKYFLHPSLLLYLTKIVSKLFFILGMYQEEVIQRNILAGRFVSAIAGVGSIGAVYLIGKELFKSYSMALLAAALVALSPLALDCSRYFKEDSLFCFFLLLVFYCTLLGLKNRKFYYLAGFLSGVTAGSKYTGITSIAFPLAALGLGSFLATFKDQRFSFPKFFGLVFELIKPGMIIVVCAILGFIAATPYAVITPGELFEGFNSERKHALNGHGGISISAWSRLFTYHLTRSLLPGITLPVMLLGLIGIGKLIRDRSLKSLLLLAAVIGYYLTAELVKSKPMPQPERYALPAAFFFVISACFVVSRLTDKRRQLCASLLLILPMFYAGLTTSLSIRPDTRETALEWIGSNIPKDKKFVLVGLPNYAPRVNRLGYSVGNLSPDGSNSRSSVPELKKSKFDYLLVTSLSYDRYFKEPEAKQSLKERYMDYDRELELVHEESKPGGSLGFHNPTLKIYKLR